MDDRPPRRRRRLLRVIGFSAIGFAVLLCLAVPIAVLALSGQRLAGLVLNLLPKLPGQLGAQAIHIRPTVLFDVLFNLRSPVTVEGFSVTDLEGTQVLWVPKVSLRIRPLSAIGGNIVLEDLVADPGTRWRFAEMSKVAADAPASERIGFLAALIPPDDPNEPATPDAGSGIRFELRNAKFLGLDVRLDFPDAFGLHLRDVVGPGSLIVEPDFVGWTVENLVARGGGFFDLLTERLPWDLVKIRKAGITRDRPDDILLDVISAETAAGPGAGVASERSRLSGRGYVTGLGLNPPIGQPEPETGIEMKLEVTEAGPAIGAVLSKRFPGMVAFSGSGAKARVELRGPFIDLVLDGAIEGLTADNHGRVVHNTTGTFRLTTADPMTVAVPKLTFEGASGGSAELSGRLREAELRTRTRFRRFGTAAYLPASVPSLREAFGGWLEGGYDFGLDFVESPFTAETLAVRNLSLEQVDLRLERQSRRTIDLAELGEEAPRGKRRARPAPAAIATRTRMRISGRARATPSSASTEGLSIELPGAVLTGRGRYGLAHRILGFGLRLTAADLPRFFSLFGLPPVAKSGAVALEVGGRPTSPQATGVVTLDKVGLPGLGLIERVAAKVLFEAGTLALEGVRSDAFGGALEGGGRMHLFRGDLLHPIDDPPLEGRLEGRGLDLAKLVPGGQITGRANFLATASGTLDKYRAGVSVPAGTEIGLFGEPWKVVGIEVAIEEDALAIRRARIERVGGGGIVLSGRAAFAGPLDVKVAVDGVPLGGLPGVALAGVPVEGRLSSRLDIRGTSERPLVEGEVRVTDVAIRGVPLGTGRIELEATEDGAVAATGDLFGRIILGGRVHYTPAGPLLGAWGKFHDVLLEQFFPEVAEFGDVRARVTGGVELTAGGANPLTVDLRLSELELSAARAVKSAQEARRNDRIALRNAQPIRAVFFGDGQLVVDPTRLVTEGGELKLSGERTLDAVRGELAGALDLELLQALLGNRVDKLGGKVNIALKLGGTPARVLAQGGLDVTSAIVIGLPQQTPAITIPSGSLRVDTSALSLSNVVVEAEGARLALGGRAGFGDGQKLRDLDFSARGDVSGALLEALGRGAIADASGRARLEARVKGTPEAPQVTATAQLGGLGFRLRDLGRELLFEGGQVALTSQQVVIRDVRAKVDGQGEFDLGLGQPGIINLRGSWPRPAVGTVKLPARGRQISMRVSNAVELDDINFEVEVNGEPERGFVVAGDVRVASGRYTQNYNLQKLVITPTIDESEVRPFYEGNPILEKLGLKLRLRTLGDTFVVQNNLVPELHAAFDLYVQGTLANTRIAGEVRPTDGRFRLWLAREPFELVPNVNQITFVETKSMARGETPELNLEAESLVTDNLNREHAVRVRITGPIGQMHISLSTNTGLDPSQALLLLLSGRTGDDGLASNGSSSAGGGSDVIGQLFSDLLEPYIDDTLQQITRGKFNLRPTLGPEGVEIRADARFGRQFDLRLGYLRGLENRRQLRAESSLWLMDYLTLRGIGEQVTYSPQEGLIEDVKSLKLGLTLDFPIRLFLR